MLTPEQQKLIRKYCILPKCIVPSFLLVFLAAGVGVVLISIDGAFLRNLNPSMLTVVLACVGSIFYGGFAIYAFLGVSHGMRSEKWRTLVTEVAARNGVFPATDDMYAEKIDALCNQPEAVAQLARVELPSAKQYLSRLILIPILAQILVFVPQFVQSYQALNAQKAVAAGVLEQLNTAFAPICEEIHYNDPYEGYRNSGYNFYGYLPESEDFESIHITVNVDNGGQIHEIHYYCDVNVHLTKEENIAKAKQSFATLHEALVASGVKTSSTAHMEVSDMSDEFWTAFTEGSYYEELSFWYKDYADASVNCHYYTKPEDQYSEYSRSYMCLGVSTNYSNR